MPRTRTLLSPQPSALNPHPLNPQPSTVSPKPSRTPLNPQPSTLNPKPSRTPRFFRQPFVSLGSLGSVVGPASSDRMVEGRVLKRRKRPLGLDPEALSTAPQPSALHPTPSTLYLHPTPSTLNPRALSGLTPGESADRVGPLAGLQGGSDRVDLWEFSPDEGVGSASIVFVDRNFRDEVGGCASEAVPCSVGA